MFDYKRVALDRVLGWFWDQGQEYKRVGFLIDFAHGEICPFAMADDSSYGQECNWDYFEFFNPSDAEKYRIKEPEIVPFDTPEELMNSEFWGEAVKLADDEETCYRILEQVTDAEMGLNCKFWFENYVALDGRRIGKVKP